MPLHGGLLCFLRPPIMSLRLSLPEYRIGGERGRNSPTIANIIVGLKRFTLKFPLRSPSARHYGGPFLLAAFLAGWHSSFQVLKARGGSCQGLRCFCRHELLAMLKDRTFDRFWRIFASLILTKWEKACRL